MARDLTGEVFGQWTVISFEVLKKPHRYYNCRCSCGTERVVQGPSLICGASVSCGCTKGEKIRQARTKHSASGHPAYSSWGAMKARCQRPTSEAYPLYGGRGIRVCERWQKFENFWVDMGATWAPGLTIERDDVNGNYEPSNCRWATMLEQGANKRDSVLIETPWGTLHQSEAARRAGISLGSLIHRMKHGWPKETWFLPPSRGAKCPASR